MANVKIIGQENHLLSCKIHEAINIHTQQLEMNRDQGYNLPPLYGTILQPHSFKTRLWITAANIITDEGMWIGSKSCAKFSTNCQRWKILFLLRNNYVGILQYCFPACLPESCSLIFSLRCQSCLMVTIKTDTIDITSSTRDVAPHELLWAVQRWMGIWTSTSNKLARWHENFW